MLCRGRGRHPVGFIEQVKELRLLIIWEEAGLCRIDVQSLKLLFGKAHVSFGHLVISVQGGLEDERVVRVERVVGLVVFEPGEGERGRRASVTPL